MLKRYIAIFTMSLAWTILFGHSIIPHDHHDRGELTAHHTLPSDHHHDEVDDHNQLGEIFSHFFHGADGISFTDTKISGDHAAKQFVAIVTVWLREHFVNHADQAPVLFPVQPDLAYIAPHLVSSGLRAPPVLIG